MRKRLLEGAPPTVREVQEAMGFGAVESARKQLDALVAERRLVKTPGRARGYRLPPRRDTPRPQALVPVVGEVQAGALTEAIETPEGYVMVETRHSPDDLFALRVRGDSMVDAAILPGDTVIVRRRGKVESGDIVVALVAGEATVKTLRRRGRRVELHPANAAYRPIVPPPAELEILGKVIELRRRLA